ncbi:MAG: hypothetical protein ABSA26_09570, partial [Thermoguttaceae bacterium]
MSFLQKPKFHRIGNSWESILNFFNGRKRSRSAGGHKRRLTFDPLEERMLLTISATTTTDKTVSSTADTQSTGVQSDYSMSTTGKTGSQAVATDDAGDFVVVWTRYDSIYDKDVGTVTDANIYARYYTNEVQRITLPSDTAKFSLIYGGNAVEKITFSATTPPANIAATSIQGMFSLACDLNGDGTIDPVTEQTAPISFSETNYVTSAASMQAALRSLGGALADVTVTATSSLEYQVAFGDASQGASMNLIQMVAPAWTSGYLPTATVTSVNQPTTVGVVNGIRILVSPTDATQTAKSIVSAFAYAGMTVTAESVCTTDDPNGLRNFNITFKGELSDTDVPLMTFGNILNSSGTALSGGSVVTIKENSAEFRVNPVEPDDPYTIGPDLKNQINPAIAMDADGDFVITWESYVDSTSSVSDIYAKRYSAAALTSPNNLIISDTTVSVAESGSSNFTVQLAYQPTSSVTVTISGGDSILTSNKSTLTFTTSNWNTPQAVTISSATDSDTLNDAASFVVKLSDLVSQTVTATQIDAQTLIVSSDAVSVPEGATNSFSVSLAAAPTANVSVTIAKNIGSDADLTAAPATLTFTPSNWSTAQTVTVSDAEDSDTTNGTATLTLSAAGYATSTVTLTEIDNDLSSIMLSATTLTVVEGGSNTLTVALSAAPTGQVEIDILKRADSTSDITAAATRLYFNTLNWSTAQTVTLSAPLDTTINNGIAYFYVYAPNNTEYAKQTVTVNEIGVGQFAIGNTLLVNTYNTLMVTEGSTNNFTVALTSQPTANVTVSIIKQAGGDADLTAAPTTLTFTTANWNVAQTVTINAAADADSINGTAVFYVIAPGYVNVPIAVSESDTTAPPNTIVVTYHPSTNTEVSVPEGGSDYFLVHLSAAPPTTVTMTISEAAGGDPDLTYDTDPATPGNQNTLTFTTANYATDQRVNVYAAADHDATGALNPNDMLNGVATLYLDVPGSANLTIIVSEIDNAPPPSTDFIITYPPLGTINTDDVVVVPEGQTNSFQISLNLTVSPLQDITVTLQPLNGSDPDLTVNPASLTFTADTLLGPGNWNLPQTVVVSAAEDADMVNGVAYLTISSPNMVTKTVTLVEMDNDIINLVVTPNQTVFVPEGGTNTYNVALSVAPAGNVTVTVGQALGDTDLSLVDTDPLTPGFQNTLTFTPADWNVPQTVTIQAAEDADNTDGT